MSWPAYTPYTDWTLIPDHMRDGMVRYVDRGVEPGSFLKSVLSNDLLGAIQRADSVNRHVLPRYMEFLMGGVPAQCWGSPSKVEAWIKHKGLLGLKEQEDATN